MKLNGADILVESLCAHGVEVVFGYPGGAVLNIYDSLYKNRHRIRHILTSHEQHAGHAADGYARASGKTGVVIATSGPGATNLVTAIATAHMDSIPLVAVTGNVDLALLGRDSFQEVDITGITLPVTKHSFLVRSASELAEVVREAFFIANDGRKGPVLIDIPKDVTAALAEYAPLEARPAVPPALTGETREKLDFALGLLRGSERPFIYAGGGVTASGAEGELGLFSRLMDAPVSCSLMGQGCFDQRAPHYVGMLGMHGTTAAARTLKECDLFIALGARFSDRVIGDPVKFAENRKILHIDIDEVEHGKNIATDLSVTGDLKLLLGALNADLPRRKSNGWAEGMHELFLADVMRQSGTERFPVTPQAVIEELCRLTDGRAIVCTEVGQNQMWAAMYYTFRTRRGFISSGGLGTMGFGLGAAIGAAVHAVRPVVNIAGDGSFGMNLGELATLARYRLPVVQLVLNNNVLGMVRQWQRLFYGNRFSETTLDRGMDYEKLAGAFGLPCFVIERAEDVRPVLEKALALNAPVLVEARIDPDQAVLPMTPAGRDITEPITAL